MYHIPTEKYFRIIEKHVLCLNICTKINLGHHKLGHKVDILNRLNEQIWPNKIKSIAMPQNTVAWWSWDRTCINNNYSHINDIFMYQNNELKSQPHVWARLHTASVDEYHADRTLRPRPLTFSFALPPKQIYTWTSLHCRMAGYSQNKPFQWNESTSK